MSSGNTGDLSPQPNMGRRQLVFTAQLFKSAEAMHYIDELFLWQTRLLLQYFDVQVVQIWGLQALISSQVIIKLRAMERQDTSMPQTILANSQVATLVGDMLSKQYSTMLLGVNSVFPLHQASVLARYGLNYCFCDFLRSHLLLPPMPNAIAEEIPTPLALAILLFFKRFPAQDELSTINLLLGQSLSVAGSRGLLLPPNTTPGSLPAISSGPLQRQKLSLSELIPHRLEDADAMRSSNPFASSAVITDRRIRRFYSAIDGRKNVGDICATIDMDLKEAYLSLQFLLEQHRVQLYEPGGQQVERSQFVDNM